MLWNLPQARLSLKHKIGKTNEEEKREAVKEGKRREERKRGMLKRRERSGVVAVPSARYMKQKQEIEFGKG